MPGRRTGPLHSCFIDFRLVPNGFSQPLPRGRLTPIRCNRSCMVRPGKTNARGGQSATTSEPDGVPVVARDLVGQDGEEHVLVGQLLLAGEREAVGGASGGMRASVRRRRTALLGEETAGLSPTTIARLRR